MKASAPDTSITDTHISHHFAVHATAELDLSFTHKFLPSPLWGL